MLPKVIRAYNEEGFKIDMGNPSRVYSTLIDSRGHRSLSVSGGLTVSDVFVFTQLERPFFPRGISSSSAIHISGEMSRTCCC